MLKFCPICSKHAKIENKDGSWTCLKHAADPILERLTPGAVELWKAYKVEKAQA